MKAIHPDLDTHGRPFQVFIYDPAARYDYSSGDLVFVYNNKKPFYHAKVLRPKALLDEEEPSRKGRVHVEYLGDKSTYLVRPKYLVPVYPSGSVVVCATTHHYRRLANSQVFATDTVLEIGCDFGETTKLIAQRCAVVYGVDKCVEHVAEAKKRHVDVRNMHLVAGDVLKNESLLLSFADSDKVFIDINGNRPRVHVETCLTLVCKLLPKTKVVVIKSKELYAAFS